MKSRPLKWRLSIVICAVLLATAGTIYILAYIELKESLLKNLDPSLKAMSEMLFSDIEASEHTQARQAAFRSIADYTGQKYPNIYRIWMDGNSKVLFTSDTLASMQDGLPQNLPADIQPAVGEFIFFDGVVGNQKYRMIWTRRTQKEGIVNVLVGTPSHYVYHEMGEFRQVLFILGASLAVGSFLLVPVIVGWTLRPVEQVAGIVRQVTPGNMKQDPLRNLSVPEELLPFVDALDGMLVRLEKAIHQQKQFVSDASHELRTPLTIIKSTIQTTRMTDRNIAEYIKALDDTLQDINRMEHLIENLLLFARIDESRGVLNTTRIELDVLLANLAEIFDVKASQQGSKVISDGCTPTAVQGVESELRQLFTNILDNAVKYSPPNSVVRVTLEHQPEGYATVCIHDEGGSIPAEALPHLFDRFYRVDSSRSRTTGGTGLGLAIAKEIVHRHNGQIKITSDRPTGTSVFVQLPRL